MVHSESQHSLMASIHLLSTWIQTFSHYTGLLILTAISGIPGFLLGIILRDSCSSIVSFAWPVFCSVFKFVPKWQLSYDIFFWTLYVIINVPYAFPTICALLVWVHAYSLFYGTFYTHILIALLDVCCLYSGIKLLGFYVSEWKKLHEKDPTLFSIASNIQYIYSVILDSLAYIYTLLLLAVEETSCRNHSSIDTIKVPNDHLSERNVKNRINGDSIHTTTTSSFCWNMFLLFVSILLVQ